MFVSAMLAPLGLNGLSRVLLFKKKKKKRAFFKWKIKWLRGIVRIGILNFL